MAEVTNRPATAHRAVAEAEVGMAQETLSAIIDSAIDKVKNGLTSLEAALAVAMSDEE